MTRSTFAILAAVALLAMSAGATAWSGKGGWEPSTENDRLDGYMFPDTDNSPDPSVRRVYFNGFTTQGTPVGTTAASPNSGLLKSAIQAPYGATYAYLGVWKDCNDDGYIGSTDASHRYPVALLDDATMCPAGSEYPTHNDGDWIYEYIPITWNNDTRLACCDANTLVDNKARVWMDVGLPDAVVVDQCTTTAPPPYTYERTGAMIAWLDCETSYVGTAAINEAADITGLGQLSFDDQPNGRQGESNSDLNQQIPVGNATDDSYVSAWDCSNGPSTVISAPHPLGTEDNDVTKNGIEGVVIWNFSDNDGHLIWTELNPSPKVPEVNDQGSFWGTVNATQREPTDCNGENGNSFSDQGVTGNVTVAQVSNRDACLVYCEASGYRTFTGRTQPTMTLQSEQWPENYDKAPVTQVMNQHLHFVGGLAVRQFWLGGLLPAQTFLNPRDATPAPAQYYTYYATLSPEAISGFGLDLPGGETTGTYGSEACAATANDGKTRFDCNRDNWWKRADGSEIEPSTVAMSRCSDQCEPRAFVGDAYHLRDIDCYDQSIGALRDAGLTVSALLSDGGCKP